MIKKYRGFLESTNNGFAELEGLIEKEVAYLNLINDIVQRYEDGDGGFDDTMWDLDLSYEFGSDINFYNPLSTSSKDHPIRLSESTIRKIINNNGEICLDKEDPFYSHGIGPVPRPRVIISSNDLLKQILKSPKASIEYDIFIYSNLSSGHLPRIVPSKIVNEIESLYPFTKIEVDPIFRPHHKHKDHYNHNQINNHFHLHIRAYIKDIRDNI